MYALRTRVHPTTRLKTASGTHEEVCVTKYLFKTGASASYWIMCDTTL
jgi:hypothetical protein